MEYGVYAFVRRGAGLPEILLMTKGGGWTRGRDAAGRWNSRAEAENVIRMAWRPQDCLNLWWFEFESQREAADAK